MSVRAVIFDLYNTLLKVDPPPADAARQWEILWREYFGGPMRLSLEEVSAASASIIAREHAAARAGGVDYPEIDWPAVALEILPGLQHLAPGVLEDFLYRHSQLQHVTSLMPGAAPVLQQLSRRNVPLGLASNCQRYSLREFDSALASAGLTRAIFQTDLCFFSFEKRFGKPSPRVFQWLGVALLERHVSPAEILMVGDRADKDIGPAQAQGWLTLHFSPADPAAGWQLLDRLEFD